MGNIEQSTPATSSGFSQSSFERGYSYEKEVNDSRFGLIKIFKNKSKPDSFAMVLNKSSLDGNYENFSKDLVLHSNLKHENLCRILGHTSESSQKLCGASSLLTIYSEYSKNNLEKELQKKSGNKDYLSEPEMWYIVDSVTKVMVYLETQRIVHGDLHASSIFVDSNGYVKVADNNLLSPYKNCFTRSVLDGETRYLAPELLEKVARKDFNVQYHWKHDVFTFGMTLLTAASLTDLTPVYENNTIDLNSLNKVIEDLRARYSATFIDTVIQMLNFNHLQRLSWGQINQILQKFRATSTSVNTGYQKVASVVQPELVYNSQRPVVYPQEPKPQQYQPQPQPQAIVNNKNYYVNSEPQEAALLYNSNYLPQTAVPLTFQNFQEGAEQYPPQQYPPNIHVSGFYPPQNYQTVKKQVPLTPNKIQTQQKQVMVENLPQQRFMEQNNVSQQPKIIEQQNIVYHQQPQPQPQQQVKIIEQQQPNIMYQQYEQQPPQPRTLPAQYSYQELQRVAPPPQNIQQQKPIEQLPQGYFIDQNGRVIEQSNHTTGVSWIQPQGMPPQGFYSNTVFNPNQTSYVQPNANLFEMPVEQFVAQQSLEGNFQRQQQTEGWNNSNDLDRRIQEALKASEETLKRNQEYLLRTNENE